jgi:hypothetical protein
MSSRVIYQSIMCFSVKLDLISVWFATKNIPHLSFGGLAKSPANKNRAKLLAIFGTENELHHA